MNAYKQAQDAFDKAISKTFDIIKRLDKTQTFVVGQNSYKQLESVVNMYGDYQGILLAVDRNNLVDHPQVFEIIKNAYSRVNFKAFKNDTFTLVWLKERGILRNNVKHLSPNVDNALASGKCTPIARYLLRMILIERKEYSYDQYCKDLDDIYLAEVSDVLVPIIPYKLLLDKTEWAEEEMANVQLIMAVNSDYNNLIDKIFLNCPKIG